MDMTSIGIVVLLIILLLVAWFFIPRWLMRRAARQVIKILRRHNATDSKNARTIDELGLRAPGVLDRMMRRRDYKPQALQMLIQAEIVQITEDGKLYLSEEKLYESGFEQGSSAYR